MTTASRGEPAAAYGKMATALDTAPPPAGALTPIAEGDSPPGLEVADVDTIHAQPDTDKPPRRAVPYADSRGFYKRPAGLKLSSKDRGIRKAVYERDGFACRLCDYQAEPPGPEWDGSSNVGRLVIDHVRSLSQGGAKRDLVNLQTLCVPCNARKC